MEIIINISFLQNIGVQDISVACCVLCILMQFIKKWVKRKRRKKKRVVIVFFALTI